MKKSMIKALCLLLCGSMALSAFGCGGGEGGSSGSTGGSSTPDGSTGGSSSSGNNYDTPDAVKYNTEERPVAFALSTPDGVFNPFFSTSAADSEVVGMTQIGMLTTDEQGNEVYGEDEPTVVLDYKKTMYDSVGNVSQSGDTEGSTVYEFIIKNDILFSDGEPLTIKDVLFNLYVYLDPAYTGSATIYSTDIKGLKAYQLQDASVSDDDEVSDRAKFYTRAATRIENIIGYAENEDGYELTDQVAEDIQKVMKLFEEEITSDWAATFGTVESYKDEYKFTEDWQLYYFLEGLVSVQTKKNENGKTVKWRDETDLNDEGQGRYFTTLDDDQSTSVYDPSPLTEEMNNYVEENLQTYMQENGVDETTAKNALQREKAIATVLDTYSDESKLPEILTYWATAGTALEEFIAEERSKEYAGTTMTVESISGITTYTIGNQNDAIEDIFNGVQYDEEHSVLRIEINGVDPKAIWNFAFAVAPMHYYSNEDAIENTPFGVKWNDKDFFDNVLNDPDKSGVPVGAGVYMASDRNDSTTNVKRSNFFSSNIVYYLRNPYFETVGDGLYNAKIKRFRYKVVGEDSVLNSLITGDIDYGQPSASQDNIKEVGNYTSYLSYTTYRTNGYGYVGINPKFVPNVNVRRAIMKAMNTSSIIGSYYSSNLAEVIYRPMSSTSWAYPKGVTEHETIAYDPTGEEIIALVEEAGYTTKNSDGVRMNRKGETLTFTFTIAGGTTDHPAFDMFSQAETLLEECGFDISVVNDPSALQALATGNLTVWAAAWSSAIDPDMYQVYHKDSTATSVNNWNYNEILNTDKFPYEQEIVLALSQKIDEGRQTLNQTTRAGIYAQALDLIMELAVELPTYQRNDLVVYNSTVINPASLNQNPSATSSVVSKVWALNYN